MDATIKKYLAGFEFGELLHFQNMGILPLLTSLDDSPEYLTLKEALEKQVLVITEVSHEGSVPELKVINSADIPVLLLDGEEVVGAKQNRVLNTTILVKEKSELVIPVSCTEQGRWSYREREFSDSDTLMSTKLRRIKAQTVSDTLADSKEFRSDQGTVWTAIHEMSEEAGARSETGAMKAAYETKMDDLNDYLKAFALVPDQKGLIAFIDGEVVGFDFVSRESAYTILHPKLLKSYAMDAILQKTKLTETPDVTKAKQFIERAQKCKEKKYESVGKGWDYRFEGKSLVGSALKFGNKVIHMAFFVITESDKAGEMASSRRRTRFRR
ncbi:MAG: hypothetical protein PVH84_18915 [Candidatus Aminicenantes bacterium]|jgi:hypothetical protein